MKKVYAGWSLVVVALLLIFAVVSFLRENWAASQSPGILERVVARWVLSAGRQPEADVRNPLPGTDENLQEGRELYQQHCTFCHGSDGRGQRPDGIQFYPPVPSLVGWESELTDGQSHFIIQHGIRYTAMPSFEKVLSSEQIWKIVLWVRELPNQGRQETLPDKPPDL
ncbi:MAG: c-type cytochrome [Acidobacteria bacterium]|nr:c-type cytochrome [Acidobacteriota bacterium]